LLKERNLKAKSSRLLNPFPKNLSKNGHHGKRDASYASAAKAD